MPSTSNEATDSCGAKSSPDTCLPCVSTSRRISDAESSPTGTSSPDQLARRKYGGPVRYSGSLVHFSLPAVTSAACASTARSPADLPRPPPPCAASPSPSTPPSSPLVSAALSLTSRVTSPGTPSSRNQNRASGGNSAEGCCHCVSTTRTLTSAPVTANGDIAAMPPPPPPPPLPPSPSRLSSLAPSPWLLTSASPPAGAVASHRSTRRSTCTHGLKGAPPTAWPAASTARTLSGPHRLPLTALLLAIEAWSATTGPVNRSGSSALPSDPSKSLITSTTRAGVPRSVTSTTAPMPSPARATTAPLPASSASPALPLQSLHPSLAMLPRPLCKRTSRPTSGDAGSSPPLAPDRRGPNTVTAPRRTRGRRPVCAVVLPYASTGRMVIGASGIPSTAQWDPARADTPQQAAGCTITRASAGRSGTSPPLNDSASGRKPCVGGSSRTRNRYAAATVGQNLAR